MVVKLIVFNTDQALLAGIPRRTEIEVQLSFVKAKPFLTGNVLGAQRRR